MLNVEHPMPDFQIYDRDSQQVSDATLADQKTLWLIAVGGPRHGTKLAPVETRICQVHHAVLAPIRYGEGVQQDVGSITTHLYVREMLIRGKEVIGFWRYDGLSLQHALMELPFALRQNGTDQEEYMPPVQVRELRIAHLATSKAFSSSGPQQLRVENVIEAVVEAIRQAARSGWITFPLGRHD
jgi:hypothetical protein